MIGMDKSTGPKRLTNGWIFPKLILSAYVSELVQS